MTAEFANWLGSHAFWDNFGTQF